VLCAQAGCVKLAVEVDHKLAIVNGGSNDLANMQGLCPQCHADKTRTDLGQTPRAQFDDKGRVKW